MSWFTSLFSSSKVVDNVLDKDSGLLSQVGGWIGNFNFTDEEQSKANAGFIESASAFVKQTLEENTVRSKTRRFIAKLWIGVELFLVLLTCAVAPFNMELAKFYWAIAMSELMFWGTLSVLGFFFGTHMLRSRNSKSQG